MHHEYYIFRNIPRTHDTDNMKSFAKVKIYQPKSNLVVLDTMMSLENFKDGLLLVPFAQSRGTINHCGDN